MIDSGNVYWTFSSAAQSVAAFIGLLVAGYALTLNIMESELKRDDTLIDIHNALKRDYFRYFVILAVIAALSILSCLLVLYFHKVNPFINICAERMAALFTGISIVGGVFFVIIIINPLKYENKIKVMSEEVKPKGKGDRNNKNDFINEFIELEKDIRAIYDKYVVSPRKNIEGKSVGLREMIEQLSAINKIGFGLYQELIIINRYRNLIVHGHVEDVDSHIVRNLKTLRKEIAG